MDGDETSGASLRFDCCDGISDPATGHCTVELWVTYDAVDGESLGVALASQSNLGVTFGYVDRPYADARFVISAPSCVKTALFFDVTRGDQTNLQSTAIISRVRTTCTKDDRTNRSEAQLYYLDGEAVSAINAIVAPSAGIYVSTDSELPKGARAGVWKDLL